jgi:hypothetical protein
LLKLLQKLEIFFNHLYNTVPHLSQAKLKEGVFVGPVIRKRMFDEDFLLTMTEVEREAWIAFKSVIKFLGNNKDPDYLKIVANMLEKFKVLGCLLSLKIFSFFNSHLNFFMNILVQ